MKKLTFGDGLSITLILTSANKFLGLHFVPPEGEVYWFRAKNEQDGYASDENEAYTNITGRLPVGPLRLSLDKP
jgi:hypothetical protein